MLLQGLSVSWLTYEGIVIWDGWLFAVFHPYAAERLPHCSDPA